MIAPCLTLHRFRPLKALKPHSSSTYHLLFYKIAELESITDHQVAIRTCTPVGIMADAKAYAGLQGTLAASSHTASRTIRQAELPASSSIRLFYKSGREP
jgi:hypothetical protein